MTERVKIIDFIDLLKSELKYEIPYNELKKLSKDACGKFDKFMFEHGLLLYLIVLKYRPSNILEIGTGGGYSSLFMMRSIDDFKISGKIYSIDKYSIDRPYKKTIKKNGEEVSEITTVRNFWSKYGPNNWEENIETRSGYSSEVLSHADLPKFDMVFIDGGHDYDTVKHDFYSSIELVSDNFIILFDDYISRPFYGVKKFVDKEVSPFFNSKIIETDSLKIDSNNTQIHARCLIESKDLKKPLRTIYPDEEIKKNIENYRRQQKIVNKYRKVLNRIPFLKNRKIKFWKTN